MISQSELDKVADFVTNNLVFPDMPDKLLWAEMDTDDLYGYAENLFVSTCDAIMVGASKAVLFWDDLPDFVVKVPLLGEKGEGGYSCQFKHAFPDSDHPTWDYCEYEEFLYDKAVQAGVDEMFCGTMYLMDVDDYPIYVSERSGKDLYDSVYTPSKQSAVYISLEASRKKRGCNFPGDLDSDAVSAFFDSWGAEKTNKLLDFLLDNDVHDCHNANVAFKDGKIRVIDYAGFRR